jgi:hypothetical protein
MNWNGNKEAKNKKHKLLDLEKKKTKKKKRNCSSTLWRADIKEKQPVIILDRQVKWKFIIYFYFG